MKFQVGDKVLVLHSNEEGEVIDIINDKMVLVDVRGVKFPAYIDQLDFPYFKRFTEKKLFPEKKQKKYVDDLKKEKENVPLPEDGLWLTFIPVSFIDEFGDEVVTDLKVHLHNRTKRSFHFDYHLSYFGNNAFDLKNEIRPFQDFYLHDVPFENMNDSPAFSFVFSLVVPDAALAPYYESVTKIKPKQLFEKLRDIRLKNEPTFSYRLFETYPAKSLTPEPEPFLPKPYYDASEGRKHIEPARTVIDLHIEKLIDNWKSLTSSEMLGLQLQQFEKYYELAVIHHQPTLIVVHGVGSGRLRDEIHDILRLKREVKSFVNQYHPSFGYGATEIYFQY